MYDTEKAKAAQDKYLSDHHIPISVDQPESNFTLRVNGEACVALFEADGGAWKNEAVENIKQYLVAGTYASNVVVIA